MADTALPVLQAVIAKLKAASSVAALVADRIYTDVPQKTAFPYLVVSIQSEPFAANDFSGQSHALRLQSFSQFAGSQEALAVRKAATEALDRQETGLSLASVSLVLCQYSGASDAFIEDDGKTWQGVSELEVLVQ